MEMRSSCKRVARAIEKKARSAKFGWTSEEECDAYARSERGCASPLAAAGTMEEANRATSILSQLRLQDSTLRRGHRGILRIARVGRGVVSVAEIAHG